MENIYNLATKFLSLLLAGALLLLAACQGSPAPERSDIAPLNQDIPPPAQAPVETTLADTSLALKAAPSPPVETWNAQRYGLIASSIDDKSFNQLAWAG